jgi:type I restriction enzyme S subunit
MMITTKKMKWIESTIGESCVVGDGAHAKIKRQDSGILYLTSKNFKNGQLDLSKVDYISEEDYKKYFRLDSKALTKPQTNDIVFSIIGTIGEPYLCQVKDFFGISSSVSILRPNQKNIYPKYLYYWLQGYLFQNALYGIKGGVAQSYVSLEMIKSLPLYYPPLPTQQKIVWILSAYDDLIENNTRRIEILEEMASMLYREWFVKFCFPGHEAVQFVESELGLIPEGWEVVKIGDIAEVGRGSSPRPIKDSKYFENGKIPWIKIADATKSGKYLYETNQKVNEYGASFSRLLPKGSLILAASGTLGYTQLLGVEGCIHDGWLYLDKFKRVDKHFLYFLFKDQETFFYNSAYGAAIQNINTTILREMKFLLPSDNIQNKFIKFIENNDKLIDNLARKNINLRKTRDLLLPRLISGEIDVENLAINTGIQP